MSNSIKKYPGKNSECDKNRKISIEISRKILNSKKARILEEQNPGEIFKCVKKSGKNSMEKSENDSEKKGKVKLTSI